MALVTGVKAAVDGLTCLRRFNLEIEGSDTATACSASAGATIRCAGTCDFRGVAEGYGHTPPKMPGELFTFKGVDVNDKGWASSANGTIVDRVHIFCSSLINDYIFYHLYFSATGSMLPTSEAVTDSGTPGLIASKGLGIKLATVAQEGILGWELIIDGNTTDPSYQSDSVMDTNTNVWPVRRMTNIDAIATWDQHFTDSANLKIPHAAFIARFLTDHETVPNGWELSWMRILRNPVEYSIAKEGGKGDFIKALKITAGFTGYYGTQGYIKNPAGTSIWP